MNMQLQSGGGGTDPTHTKPGTERRDRVRALVKKIFGPPAKADRLKIFPLNRKDHLSFAEGVWLEWFHLCNWQIATTPRNMLEIDCHAPVICTSFQPSLRHWKLVCVQNEDPAVLSPATLGTHFKGVWVGLWACLDRKENSHNGIRSPDCPDLSNSG
jgi:hypothetical protein